MYFAFAAFGIVSVLGAIYLYFFVKRIFATFGADVKTRKLRIISGVIALILGACSVNLFSFFGVALLHFVVMALFVQLANFIIKKLAKEKYNSLKIWKKAYGSGVIALAVTLSLMIGGYINLHNVVATEYTVATDKDIREEGYRVALLSDIHFGVSIDYGEMLEVCAEISAKEPDMVILCGDIVDNDTSREEMFDIFRALGTIKSEYGTFYVHGNHDRPFGFGGFESEFTEEELISSIESNGITILRDETYEIAPDFVIAGREDRSASQRMTTARLLENTDGNKFVLTLDHQPREYAETAATATDLVLSGHTHGGQLWPLKQVQEIFNMNDEVYGHGYIDDDTQYIVTSGVAGWKYPIKTAAPAEYVIIDIKG